MVNGRRGCSWLIFTNFAWQGFSMLIGPVLTSFEVGPIPLFLALTAHRNPLASGGAPGETGRCWSTLLRSARSHMQHDAHTIGLSVVVGHADHLHQRSWLTIASSPGP